VYEMKLVELNKAYTSCYVLLLLYEEQFLRILLKYGLNFV